MAGEELRFGDFRLDPGRRALTRNGAPVPLKGRAIDILCVLADARGEVVTKDTLMERVWPGLVVEENNIQQHISALRKALEGAKAAGLLVTVPGRGYRFVVPRGSGREALSMPDKPSIAVLPFTNMSDDPAQQYFADGIAEDIITALSRIRWLFVIARNSSFVYKDRNVDVRQIGVELGVRYVLEGSVRKAGEPRAHHGPAHRRRQQRSCLGRQVRRAAR